MNTLYHIIDNIYLSNLDSALDLSRIDASHIKSVFRLSEDANNSTYPSTIEFINFELEDNFLERHLMIVIAERIYDLIQDRSHNILIHCNMGQSRSVSVIMYYLMRKHKMNFREALNHIRSIKSDVKVNEGFERILREFDNSINGSSRVANTSNPSVQRNCSIRLS